MSPKQAQVECANIECHLRNMLSLKEREDAGIEGRDLHIQVMRALSFLKEQTPQGWQDISTAPTDEDVLVYFPTHAPEMSVLVCHQFEDADGWYHQNADSLPDELTEQPTHWMPLPSPPVSSDQETA